MIEIFDGSTSLNHRFWIFDGMKSAILQFIPMIAKHNPAPAEPLSIDYDTALGSMTEEGSVGDDVLKEEILTRAELIKAANIPDASRFYDYSHQKKLCRAKEKLETEVVTE